MELKGALLDLESATTVLGSEYGSRQVNYVCLHARVTASVE